MTQSLLSSWIYQWTDFSKYEYFDELEKKAHKDFLRALRREKVLATELMMNGRVFEKLVTDIIDGKDLSQNYNYMCWGNVASIIASEVKGGQLQLAVTEKIVVDEVELLLQGQIGCLEAGSIYDIKFCANGSYEVGKYINSPQHPLYFRLVPEAGRFVYLVSNGTRIWKETYLPEECRPIDNVISEFIEYLKTMGLFELYCEKWKLH